MELLLTIRAMLPGLNEQEQKVGQYVLAHPAEVMHLAIGDLAQRTASSDATIFRFCRKLGAGGYQDFKIRLAQEVAARPLTAYADVTADDDLRTAAEKVISADIKALQDSLRVFDLEALRRAADTLLAARRVDVYASGGAAVAALELQYKLTRVGVRAVVHADVEMQVISATLLSAADAAVGISHSGAVRETLHALETARQAGATLIAITNHPTSAIARVADISLCTAAQESLAHGYPLGARVAQVALIDVLYTLLAMQRPEETARSQARIASALHYGQS